MADSFNPSLSMLISNGTDANVKFPPVWEANKLRMGLVIQDVPNHNIQDVWTPRVIKKGL